jgi:hypothetical protein
MDEEENLYVEFTQQEYEELYADYDREDDRERVDSNYSSKSSY